MFNTIVVAYDGSDHAKRALSTAVDLAGEDGAIHLCHVPQMETPALVMGSFVSELSSLPSTDEVAERGRRVCEEAEKLMESKGGRAADSHVGAGDPVGTIIEVAEKSGADLIVMGRRGLGAIGSLALGSVSLGVAHRAKCACLTVV